MARRPELKQIAKEYHLPYFTIADLQEYCRSLASKRPEFVKLPTEYGEFQIKSYGHGNVVLQKVSLTLISPSCSESTPSA